VNRLRAVSMVAAFAAAAAVACSDDAIPTQAGPADAAVAVLPAQALSVDQTSGLVGGTSWGCGAGVSGVIGQGFTPAWRTLGAIDIVVRAGGGFPSAGVTTTLYLYDGNPADVPPIASSSSVVSGLATGDTVSVRFLFLPPLRLQPGNRYLMAWTAPGDEVLTWMVAGQYSGGVPVPCGGITIASPIFDLAFSTYRVGR